MLLRNACVAGLALTSLACSTQSQTPYKPPAPLPVATPCPIAKPDIRREFYAAPPACLEAPRAPFKFKCTPDPNNPGFCIESIGSTTIDGAQKIADGLACERLARDWVAAEREAQKINGRAS